MRKLTGILMLSVSPINVFLIDMDFAEKAVAFNKITTKMV
jgi:hypothetical protein